MKEKGKEVQVRKKHSPSNLSGSLLLVLNDCLKFKNIVSLAVYNFYYVSKFRRISADDGDNPVKKQLTGTKPFSDESHSPFPDTQQ
jgi:hypothetical protein